MRGRIIASFTVLAVLAVAACTPRAAWVKPGATDEDFARDSHECERDARASAGSYGAGLAGGVSAAIDSGGFQRACLHRRGWVAAGEATAESPPPEPPTPAPAPADTEQATPAM